MVSGKRTRVVFAMAATFPLMLTRLVPAAAQVKPVDGKVLISYDERKLSDSQFARLAAAIAADAPDDTWLKITVLKGEGLTAVVDRIYDVYSSVRGRFV